MIEKKILEDDYSPLPQQSKFHQSKAKYRCYLGGLGAGKTEAGSREAKLLLLENPGIVILIARQTYPELRDTTMRTFFDTLPKDLIKSWNKSENHLVLKNGSEVLFRSLDDPMKLKSLELGFFWIDEASEVSEDIFLTLQGRIRQNKKGVTRRGGYLTTNPPNTGHWIEKHFIEKGVSEYELIKATTYENREHLPDGYIEDLERNYPPQWIKKYLYGEFGFTSAGKPVYPMFMEALHVRDLSYYWKTRNKQGRLPTLQLYRGWDFGFNFPAMIVTTVDDQGRWLILKEFLGREIIVNDLADKGKLICATEFPEGRYLDYCDPAGDQKNDKTGTRTSCDILRAHRIYPTHRFSTPLERSEIIGRLLQKTVDGLPAIMIDKGCKICIDAFSGGYHFKKPVNNEKYQQDVIEKDGFFEHVMDALGYIAANLFMAAITGTRPKPGKIGNWQDFKKENKVESKYSVLSMR
jgi:hypothetical protein